MTLKDIAAKTAKIRCLKSEEKRILRKIEHIESLAEKTTPSLSGMPHGSGTVDKVGDCVVLMDELKQKLKEIRLKIASEEKSLENLLDSIDDCIVSQALKLKYVDQLSWSATAKHIGGNSGDSVRKACERYLLRLK